MSTRPYTLLSPLLTLSLCSDGNALGTERRAFFLFCYLGSFVVSLGSLPGLVLHSSLEACSFCRSLRNTQRRTKFHIHTLKTHLTKSCCSKSVMLEHPSPDQLSSPLLPQGCSSQSFPIKHSWGHLLAPNAVCEMERSTRACLPFTVERGARAPGSRSDLFSSPGDRPLESAFALWITLARPYESSHLSTMRSLNMTITT